MQQMYPLNGSLLRYHSAPSYLFASLVDALEPDPRNDNAIVDSTSALAAVEDTDFDEFLAENLCNLPISSLLEPLMPSADFPPQLPCLVDRDISLPTLYHDADTPLKLVHELKKESFIIYEEDHSASTTDVLFSGAPPSHGFCDRGLVDMPPIDTSLDNTALTDKDLSAAYHRCSMANAEMAESSTLELRYTSSPTHVLSSSYTEISLPSDACHTTPIAPSPSSTMLRTAINIDTMASVFPPSIDVSSTFTLGKPSADAGIQKIPQAQSITYTLSPPVDRRNSLLRQSSSPADFISYMSDEVASPSWHTSPPLSRNSTENKIIGRDGAASPLYTFESHRSKHRQDFHDMHVTAQSSESTSASGISTYSGLSKLASTEVLCKVSAKRGFATHPRSIAERVRRTKINEGIKKLQELMPDMDKAMNQVTMLDEAVEYIKNLQRQVEELSACRQHCNGDCHEGGNSNLRKPLFFATS